MSFTRVYTIACVYAVLVIAFVAWSMATWVRALS